MPNPVPFLLACQHLDQRQPLAPFPVLLLAEVSPSALSSSSHGADPSFVPTSSPMFLPDPVRFLLACQHLHLYRFLAPFPDLFQAERPVDHCFSERFIEPRLPALYHVLHQVQFLALGQVWNLSVAPSQSPPSLSASAKPIALHQLQACCQATNQAQSPSAIPSAGPNQEPIVALSQSPPSLSASAKPFATLSSQPSD